MWQEQITKFGLFLDPMQARLHFTTVTKYKLGDVNLPADMANMDYSKIPGITDDPQKNAATALSGYLREIVPQATYDALADLYTYSVLGDGVDAVINLEVSQWHPARVVAIRCWAKLHELHTILEVDPVTSNVFLSIRK